MKILTIIGARPQFIKAATCSKVIAENKNYDITEIIVHTGQHYDSNMSDIFFEELNIPKPKYNLAIGGGTHGQNTGRMLEKIEHILKKENPDWVLVYGDTDSTLAGALAASKLNIPIAHVESGLRSFNMLMPEEINRILTDQISQILFCPTQTAVKNLEREGFNYKPVCIAQVGDVMQDSVILFSHLASKPANMKDNPFILATLHRAENTDSIDRLSSIVIALNYIHKNICSVILPLHPRTRKAIEKFNLNLNVDVIGPAGYFEMLWLLKNTQLVLTDSGGVQKEAFFFGKPCVTMRDQTEWLELIDIGANELVGADTDKIINASLNNIGRKVVDSDELYGGGKAASKIIDTIYSYFVRCNNE